MRCVRHVRRIEGGGDEKCEGTCRFDGTMDIITPQKATI
jgi:hypothetical protein